nr:glycosyltransferase [Paenibacillus sp.]
MILPVYNVEKYLDRCIASIREQSLKDIQIILVNDGSTDRSLSICEKYAKDDERIIVINKPNGGVSSARNAGIKYAEGEYVSFVDPDDWIESDMYRSMYNQIKESQAEVCLCNYVMENENDSKLINLEFDKELLQQDDINDLILNLIAPSSINSGVQYLMGNVWRLLINKEFLNEKLIFFPEDIPFMEDLVFCIGIFSKSSTVCINNNYFYHYCIRTESASKLYRENLAELQLRIFTQIETLLNTENIYSSAKIRLNLRYVDMCISAISNEVHSKKNLIEKIKKIDKLCKNEKLEYIITHLNTKGYTSRKKVVLNLIRNKRSISVYTYYHLLHLFMIFKH